MHDDGDGHSPISVLTAKGLTLTNQRSHMVPATEQLPHPASRSLIARKAPNLARILPRGDADPTFRTPHHPGRVYDPLTP